MVFSPRIFSWSHCIIFVFFIPSEFLLIQLWFSVALARTCVHFFSPSPTSLLFWLNHLKRCSVLHTTYRHLSSFLWVYLHDACGHRGFIGFLSIFLDSCVVWCICLWIALPGCSTSFIHPRLELCAASVVVEGVED